MPADYRRCPVTIPATAATVSWRCVGWLDDQGECSHRRYHPDTPTDDERVLWPAPHGRCPTCFGTKRVPLFPTNSTTPCPDCTEDTNHA